MIDIRELQPSDRKRVLAIESQRVNGWSESSLDEQLCADSNQSSSKHNFVIHKDGECLGFALFRSVLDEAELLLIVIDAEYRSRGFATLLLQYSLEKLKQFDIKVCHLEVSEKNTSAIALYERFSFKAVGCRKAYYQAGDNGERNDAILMKLEFREAQRK